MSVWSERAEDGAGWFRWRDSQCKSGRIVGWWHNGASYGHMTDEKARGIISHKLRVPCGSCLCFCPALGPWTRCFCFVLVLAFDMCLPLVCILIYKNGAGNMYLAVFCDSYVKSLWKNVKKVLRKVSDILQYLVSINYYYYCYSLLLFVASLFSEIHLYCY